MAKKRKLNKTICRISCSIFRLIIDWQWLLIDRRDHDEKQAQLGIRLMVTRILPIELIY